MCLPLPYEYLAMEWRLGRDLVSFRIFLPSCPPCAPSCWLSTGPHQAQSRKCREKVWHDATLQRVLLSSAPSTFIFSFFSLREGPYFFGFHIALIVSRSTRDGKNWKVFCLRGIFKIKGFISIVVFLRWPVINTLYNHNSPESRSYYWLSFMNSHMEVYSDSLIDWEEVMWLAGGRRLLLQQHQRHERIRDAFESSSEAGGSSRFLVRKYCLHLSNKGTSRRQKPLWTACWPLLAWARLQVKVWQRESSEKGKTG